jgi:5-methylcytosine-specific restriction endonuclease McrA
VPGRRIKVIGRGGLVRPYFIMTSKCIECKTKKSLPSRRKCWKCAGKMGRRARRRKRLLEALGTTCSMCGFVAKHPAQIDIDHINGDSRDDRPNNLQVLCANCHRLKTVLNEDWKPNILE